MSLGNDIQRSVRWIVGVIVAAFVLLLIGLLVLSYWK